ncbi:ATP-dependent zinc metalloprotease YME1-like protein [Colletotrichum viniferum]|nr:ATP-dependent zinc metalloprotease YME1-like protein [Colletotrichum viniferum]
MDPDDLFDRFNEIIAPDFSLVTGRRLDTASNASNDQNAAQTIGNDEDVTRNVSSNENDEDSAARHETQLVSTTADNDAQSDLEKTNKESNEESSECNQLPSDAKIARNLHWKLIEPIELVYIKNDSGSWAEVSKEECVLVTDIEEMAISEDDGGGDDKVAHVLRHVRACHNGDQFGLIENTFSLDTSSQEIVNITVNDLGVIPMRLLPALERENIEARLVSRGKKYHGICESSHNLMNYKGPILPLDRETQWTWTVSPLSLHAESTTEYLTHQIPQTNQRVVVDTAGWKMQSAGADDSSISPHRGTSLKSLLSNEGHTIPQSDDPSSSQGENPMSEDALPDAKSKQKSPEYGQTREDHEWTDIDYLTCPPTLVAFLLYENKWVSVDVEHLTDIIWPESPFDSLELEVGKKKLIQDLTHRFKKKEVSQGSHQDTGGQQGGNLVIFLTGPPGVGKTLTAEIVAEEAQRPLYRVSAGEFSVNPSDLGKRLGEIFLLARRWGAIILIDEAGMFMTKRQASTPAQNVAITAFLWLLHTYDGLIFLTSTSEDIDTAFYDCIHATIKYVGPDETQRTNIWRRQLQRAVGSPEEHPLSSRWPEETYRLLGKVETNGREIRNIVRTAEQLALGLSTELAMEHVAAAMRNFGGSDNDVESICEKLEMLEEKVGGGRGLACDDDVELQH